MITQDINEYIQMARQAGLSDKQITQKMISVGWQKSDIQNVLAGMEAGGPEILLSMRNIWKKHDIGKINYTVALQQVNLDIYKGEFLAVTGKSGSGKSTLLNLLGLIDVPTEGEISINNKTINSYSEREQVNYRLRKVSFIFQFFNLVENYTAMENIIFQLRLQGIKKKKAKEKAMEILGFLDLTNKAHAYPKDLSGGEQQRVAVGRAIAKDSQFILADEPTAHLDAKNSQALINLLSQVNKTMRRTVVLVTHDQDQANMADRQAVLQDGKVLSIIKKSKN